MSMKEELEVFGKNSLAWFTYQELQVDGLRDLRNNIAKILLFEILLMAVKYGNIVSALHDQIYF
uniref:Uncharacterized protein n=1 Tax=Glossina pallidipes TaxID=7398 RepID=A0A1B0A183_GLOPL